METYYRSYLHRAPDPPGLAAQVRALGRGVLEAVVIRRILTSREYTGAHPTAEGFVTALYQDLLGRAPSAGELTSRVKALGRGARRAGVVDGLLASEEFRSTRADSLYRSALGREPDARELTARARPRASLRQLELGLLASDQNVANLASGAGASRVSPLVTEFPLGYPSGKPLTHEILADPTSPGRYCVTSPGRGTLVRFDAATGQAAYHQMPEGAQPHGMLFDRLGRFWVSLENVDRVVQVDPETFGIIQTVEVGTGGELTRPHGIALGADGLTVWFTGQDSATVGRINPDHTVQRFALPTTTARPPYLVLGPDGNMWGTEGDGADNVFRVTRDGVVTEFPLPAGFVPTVIARSPDGRQFVWVVGVKAHAVARIDMSGRVDEFAVPKAADNMDLNGLGFDARGNLYTLSYVGQAGPQGGPDYVVELSSAVLDAPGGDLSRVLVMRHRVPSVGTMFHRVILGTDGNMYFTELGTDTVGRLLVARYRPGT